MVKYKGNSKIIDHYTVYYIYKKKNYPLEPITVRGGWEWGCNLITSLDKNPNAAVCNRLWHLVSPQWKLIKKAEWSLRIRLEADEENKVVSILLSFFSKCNRNLLVGQQTHMPFLFFFHFRPYWWHSEWLNGLCWCSSLMYSEIQIGVNGNEAWTRGMALVMRLCDIRGGRRPLADL